MANYNILKAAIADYVKNRTGLETIDGDGLQQTLLSLVNSLGANYQYADIATPDTNPGTPDQNVFYLASTAGTYFNFGGLVLADGEIAILKYNGAWVKDSTGAASLEIINQLSQGITGLNIDINETKIDAPFSAYETVYRGYIPVGCLIINYSPAAIGVHLVDEESYTLVDARKSFYVSTKAVVRIQTLSAAMSSGSVYILAPIVAAIKSIRPVDSLLNKSKNLFNPTAEDVSLNSYINGAGVVASNNNYHTSGIIRIEPGKQYVFSRAGSAYSVRGIYVYAANGVLADSYANSSTFTAKAECCFVRFYANKADFSSIQLEQAETPTSFVPYSEKIKPLYLPEIDARQKQMNAFALAGSLSSGQALSKSINIYKGIMMSAKITGAFSNVAMGLGYNGTYGRWVEVSQTQVTLMDRNGQHATPRDHGLTLGDFTTIELSKDDNTGDFTVRVINDYGEIYEWVMGNIGQAGGNPFLMNLGSSAISAKFTIFPRDLSANIWGFGDSYFSFQYPSRWPYYAITWGYDKWLINARGGEDSAEGYIDFITLLSTGAIPEYALWCYGMNDGSDGETPNATWLSNIQAFIQDCEDHNITPILATIPTVPSINHDQKNAWVRNSGYRYIDFAAYVEADGSDFWRGWGTENALLNTDEVHPTTAGGKVLWQAVLDFFPEIATNY